MASGQPPLPYPGIGASIGTKTVITIVNPTASTAITPST